ncbi:MAG TPA: mannose-1-phosphate guanylyltransferase [Myxococcota bacterium]|nr:mannose-1-phosphate guanylyltransferase [Myxococcota bacterium]
MSQHPHIVPVVLAGGVGSRFWPLSREGRPKQLLDLFGEGPMLRVTLERVTPFAAMDRALIVTSGRLAPTVGELLPEVPASRILAEPSGKNTAPAIAWAAMVALAEDPEAVLMVLPSDHHIADVPAYQQVVRTCVEVASQGRLATVGIVPTHPETGYGYIERGAARGAAFEVARFVEKPKLETALEFLAGGRHLWNAGMFFMPARLFLDELLRLRPSLATPMLEAGPARLLEVWSALESISVDYAVFEHTDKVDVVPGQFGWSDVGSWRSLLDHRGSASSFHSSFRGGEVIEVDGHDNVLFSTGGVVSVVGVSGLVVVHTPDATFVCRTDDAQRARDVVAEVKRRRPDLL